MTKINVHAGHNPDGMVACGAVGYLAESTCARAVKDFLINKLRNFDYDVLDCTCNEGVSVQDVLDKILTRCNSRDAALDISIHLNAFSEESANGVEVWYYTDKMKPISEAVCKAISGFGFKNRGAKTGKNLRYLRESKNPAILIECCFVTSEQDAKRFNAELVATAICSAILEVYPQTTKEAVQTETAVTEFGIRQNGLAWYDKTEFVKEVEKITMPIGYMPTGNPDALNPAALPVISKVKNNRIDLVWAVQKRLTVIGYDVGEVDGIAGNKFDAGVKAFQSANGLTPDGIVGKNTWFKLLQ